jgi:hypothetical protein
MDLLTILATAADASAHSQTAFLLIGGALAAFAVIVSVIGLTRPSLDGSANTAIMGVGSLLVVGTMIAIVAVS